jgi:hypothetical protein
MVYTRRSKTENDWFIAGDSGAGYLNPGMLQEPSAKDRASEGKPQVKAV